MIAPNLLLRQNGHFLCVSFLDQSDLRSSSKLWHGPRRISSPDGVTSGEVRHFSSAGPYGKTNMLSSSRKGVMNAAEREEETR